MCTTGPFDLISCGDTAASVVAISNSCFCSTQLQPTTENRETLWFVLGEILHKIMLQEASGITNV